MMTANQKRALQLAEQVINQQIPLHQLSDESWHLLVLASGLTHCSVPAKMICDRVIENYLEGKQYFSSVEGAEDVSLPGEDDGTFESKAE
jgi:hypothetical protein